MGCGASAAAREKFHQTIVVLRHSERLDHIDKNYGSTPEGIEWPFDTPLTDNGIQLAKDTARELAEVHERANFSCVVCSPYRRCMQTAAEVANRLKLPLMIDQEVGEVWEEKMPSDRRPHRTPIQLEQMAKELGVTLCNPILPEGGIRIFGKPPQHWPETINEGSYRCAVRVRYYIEESYKTRKNFIIVSHAPAVSAMSTIFNRGLLDISGLEYCSYVVADRIVATDGKQDDGLSNGTFEDTWEVDLKGVHSDLNLDASEEQHATMCQDVEMQMAKRRILNSMSDNLQEDVIRKTASLS